MSYPKWGLAALLVIASTAVAVLGRLGFDWVVGQTSTFLVPFLFPVVVVALFHGTRWGLATTAVNAALVVYFFTPPEFGFAVWNFDDRVRVGTLAVFGAVLSALTGRIRRYQQRAEETARAMVGRQAELEREVAERRGVEQRLTAGHALLRLVTDHVPVLLVHCDRELRYTFVNRTYADRFGLDPQDVLGRTVREVLGPAGYDRISEHLVAALAGKTVEFEADITYPKIGPRRIQCTCRPDASPGGRVNGFVATILDITERERAADALRASERRYRALIQATPQIVWTSGGGGGEGAGWWFDLTGQPPDEAAGWGWLDAVHPDDRERVRAAWTGALAAGTLYDTEYRVRIRSGEFRHFAIRGVPLTNAGGALEEWVGTLTDVHDRTVAQERLRELNATLERRVEERTAALREGAAFSRGVLDSLPAHIAVLDRTGTITAANRGWEQFAEENPGATGIASRAGIGFDYLAACDASAARGAADAKAAAAAIRRVLADGDPWTGLEYDCHAPDRHRWFAMTAAPLRTATGGAVVSHTDITVRVLAESEVRSSEERFRVLFERSSDAHLIFSEADGILDCNPAAVAMLRCPDKAALLRLHPAELSPDLQPDGRRSMEKCVEMDATARRNGYHRFDWDHRRLDGEVFPCEVTLTPVTVDGRAVLLVVWHELTERKRAEAAVRESEDRFRAFMDNSPAVAWIKDEGGRYVYLNRRFEELHGVRLADWLGRTDRDVWPAPLADELQRNDRATLDADRVLETTERVPNAAGEVRVWRAHKFPVRAAGGGRLVGGTALDVTEEQTARDRVNASLREKEVLLKEIHHRVKNNLQIVSALLELQSGHTSDRAVVEMFRESQGRVKSMALIHERLYRSGDFAGVDFGAYVRQLADDLYRTYKVSDDDIRLDLAVDIPPVPIDIAIPCGLLLNELVSNCLKHAFRDATEGRIGVSLVHAAGATVLSVSDDGAGFEPGIDFRNTPSFGLQLVNTLVEQLDGAVELASGPGATITVRFPNPKP